MFDVGEDLTVEDDRGRPAFRVDGKVLTLRKTFVLEDLDGHTLATIRRPLVAIRDTVSIERPGLPDAKVKHALLSLLRKRYHVELKGGDLEVEGNIVGHEYAIKRGRETAARISKGWFQIRDTYGIEVEAGEDTALMISIAVALEEFDRGE
ncbi:MAG TPA: LURP-one-related family protein [Thermoanaerobaculia bacterium]|nr:LURP-one-related family protein [Thermoanaerobaculia bacterium]